MSQFRFLSSLICVVLLTACSTTDLTKQTSTKEITIFSINDFHGNLQSDKPVPYLVSTADPHDTEKHLTTPAGGYAYLAGLLKERRKLVGASILVGGGDLIGASPMGSALLKDEPVIEALNQLDLQVTAVGNHEFDKGTAELRRKIHGQCPPAGCVFPDFHGAKFTYLGANVFEKGDKNTWLPPYAIRDVGGMKIGFIGAVTTDVPNLVAGDAVKKMSFEDEATAINRYVPELQKQGVAAIVLLIHEGATYKGAANDPTYRCEGLQGPIIDIVKKLDKAISLVISAHTHQAYTCKIDGHLVVQGKSYGAYLTESTLTIDTRMHTVVKAEAKNILVDQQKVNADPTAQKLVRQVEQQTNKMRQQFVAMVDAPLKVESEKAHFDSALGNVIADAQLKFAQHHGAADMAFMNAGGIRSDLPSGNQEGQIAINYGDIYAVQPFGNSVVQMKLTGAQIMKLLEQQWKENTPDEPKKLFISHGLTYHWNPAVSVANHIQNVKLNGLPLNLTQQYTVIVNSFLADGGDGFSIFKQGTDRRELGRDLDAFESYVRDQGPKLNQVDLNRVK